MLIALLLLFFCAPAFAQDAPKLEFEVASIKPAAPQETGRMMMGMRGGPETPDPSQITFTNVTLRFVITQAFNIKGFQLTAPAAIDDAHFDITARVPKGASKNDSRVMMQNLLADRFGMKVHHESKEMQVYALVTAKGGAKLKSSAEAAPSEEEHGANPPGPIKRDKDGFPILPAGRRGMIMMVQNGEMRLVGSQQTAKDICDFLGNNLNKMVVDETGLTAKYDIAIRFAPENGPMLPAGGGPGGRGDGASPPPSNDPAPTLISALQDQLGLRLETRKMPVDVVVVDHIEKQPTEN
jgi:uncharacterized protein (TIGR03435 family)